MEHNWRYAERDHRPCARWWLETTDSNPLSIFRSKGKFDIVMDPDGDYARDEAPVICEGLDTLRAAKAAYLIMVAAGQDKEE